MSLRLIALILTAVVFGATLVAFFAFEYDYDLVGRMAFAVVVLLLVGIRSISKRIDREEGE